MISIVENRNVHCAIEKDLSPNHSHKFVPMKNVEQTRYQFFSPMKSLRNGMIIREILSIYSWRKSWTCKLHMLNTYGRNRKGFSRKDMLDRMTQGNSCLYPWPSPKPTWILDVLYIRDIPARVSLLTIARLLKVFCDKSDKPAKNLHHCKESL